MSCGRSAAAALARAVRRFPAFPAVRYATRIPAQKIESGHSVPVG